MKIHPQLLRLNRAERIKQIETTALGERRPQPRRVRFGSAVIIRSRDQDFGSGCLQKFSGDSFVQRYICMIKFFTKIWSVFCRNMNQIAKNALPRNLRNPSKFPGFGRRRLPKFNQW